MSKLCFSFCLPSFAAKAPRAAQLLQLSVLSFVACFVSSPVFADAVGDVIEEVIVTGEFRDTSVASAASSLNH